MLYRNEIVAALSLLSATSDYSAFADPLLTVGAGRIIKDQGTIIKDQSLLPSPLPSLAALVTHASLSFLSFPKAAFGTDVDPIGYKAVAPADAIMDAPESLQIYVCNDSLEWVPSSIMMLGIWLDSTSSTP